LKNRIHIASLALIALSLFSFKADEYLDFSYYAKDKIYEQSYQTKKIISDILIKDKVTVLVFHSLKCPFSLSNQPKIDHLWQKYEKDSVKFVYVNCNPFENNPQKLFAETQKFASKCGCLYLLDREYILKDLFKADKNGTCVVCKRIDDKKIVVYYQGSIDANPQSLELNNNLLDLSIANGLQNKVSTFSAIETGCRILSH
jgi:hypothetical protein